MWIDPFFRMLLDSALLGLALVGVAAIVWFASSLLRALRQAKLQTRLQDVERETANELEERRRLVTLLMRNATERSTRQELERLLLELEHESQKQGSARTKEELAQEILKWQGETRGEQERRWQQALSQMNLSHVSAMRHETAMSVIRNIDGGKSRVRFRAGAPRAASPGSEISVRFVAYTPAEEQHIAQLLESVAENAEARVERSETSWVIGTKAEVRCYGNQLHVAPELQRFTWEGQRVHLDFDVTISADARLDVTTRIRFDVLVDGIVVARLRIGLEIVPPSSVGSDRHDVMAESAKTAFASYASSDRARVLDRVASVRTATGLDVWMDCVSLRPNDPRGQCRR